MTSMRMRLLLSVSCVHLVLVCSGVVHWWGGWGGGPCECDFCCLFLVFTLFWSVLVRYIGGEGGGGVRG